MIWEVGDVLSWINYQGCFGSVRQLAQLPHRFHLRFPCWGLLGSEFRVSFRHQIRTWHFLGWASLQRDYILSLAVGIHEFFELSGALDLEKHLLSILYKLMSTWLFTLRFSCSLFVASVILKLLYRVLDKLALNNQLATHLITTFITTH